MGTMWEDEAIGFWSIASAGIHMAELFRYPKFIASNTQKIPIIFVN